ncbi:hypothetical protein [Melissococcus sp. OM08-11BH]|uniref:hypothetical protein n=1 Tax=Melissococcus sp. OM08-11BH TaxID=2293110 RepID=UPI000E498E0F|nr:hypothetical protein [Melissococcus sp. OM08-11BH]RGI31861.1 hypothetical protein DXC12_00735 [Melissococcus sp. OM08-11BH]
MNEKKLTINGNKVTFDYLFKKADELIGVKNTIDSSRDLIDLINNVFSSGDDFSIKYFIQSGGLERLELSLEDVSKRLETISNSICPDEQVEGVN